MSGREHGDERVHQEPADHAPAARADRLVARDPYGILGLQRTAGNAAVQTVLSVQRQRRGRASGVVGPRQARATVTRVIVVTTNDRTTLPVAGAPGTTVPQQEVWRAVATALAGSEPAPDRGRTEIIEVPDYAALVAAFQRLVAGGARVSRLDFVGHGQPHGFNLNGVHARAHQWISADDIVSILRETGVARGSRHFEVHFRACYTDPVVGRLVSGLRGLGIRDPVVTAVGGAYAPPYGPPPGSRNTRDRRDWRVRDPGTNMRSDAPPAVRPADLRGL